MIETQEKTYTFLGWFGALWGVLGFSYILFNALSRLGVYAIDTFNYSLSWYQWLILIGWAVFMAISEGYRGFQKAFSPRFAARVRWLRANPKPLYVLLAPIFSMGFIGSTKKRKIVVWCLTIGILILIQVIRLLSQPWRGIIDIGVVIGLGWGFASVLWFVAKALTQEQYDVDPELGIKDI